MVAPFDTPASRHREFQLPHFRWPRLNKQRNRRLLWVGEGVDQVRDKSSRGWIMQRFTGHAPRPRGKEWLQVWGGTTTPGF